MVFVTGRQDPSVRCRRSKDEHPHLAATLILIPDRNSTIRRSLPPLLSAFFVRSFQKPIAQHSTCGGASSSSVTTKHKSPRIVYVAQQHFTYVIISLSSPPGCRICAKFVPNRKRKHFAYPRHTLLKYIFCTLLPGSELQFWITVV